MMQILYELCCSLRMSAMNASAGTGVFVLSLLSIPISYLLNHLIYSNSAGVVLFFTLSVLIILIILSRAILRKGVPIDPLFYVFAVSACHSVLNLIIGLEQDDVIDGFMTFYLKHAEPYINTSHGHMITYWEGCAHYLMYLLMVAAITWGASYRAIGSYWVGSILMRIIVYVPGNIVGKYGIQLNIMFLLHMSYVCVLIWACFRVFSQPSSLDQHQMNILEEQRKTPLQRPFDLILIILISLATLFCIFRGLVVLDCPGEWCQEYAVNYEPYLRDPSAYPKIQMLVNMLYSVPCFIIMIYGLVVPGCNWLPDLSLVHSGAVAQAQFSHIGASLHSRTPFTYRVPSECLALFLMLNLLYALLPQALSYRCLTNPAFFLTPSRDNKSE